MFLKQCGCRRSVYVRKESLNSVAVMILYSASRTGIGQVAPESGGRWTRGIMDRKDDV